MSKTGRRRGVDVDKLTFHDLGADLSERHTELAAAAAEEDLQRSGQGQRYRRRPDDQE